MSNEIQWEPWPDPFHKLIRAYEDEEGGGVAVFDRHVFRGPCAVTPEGLFPIHEDQVPSRVYKFWLGHANFDVTGPMAELISREPGVETLDVLSRYRFRISVGKAFQDEAVKKAVSLTVRNPGRAQPSSTLAVLPILSFLRRQRGFWALLVFPGGSTTVVRGASPAEVERKAAPLTPHASHLVYSWE